MITNYIPNTCRYDVNNLKKVVHIFSESENVIHIDNGQAYVTSGITDFQTIYATSVEFAESTSYDDRFKFEKQITVTVDGFLKLDSLNEKYYVVLEDENHTMWLVNADFPSFVTYTYTLADGTDETVFTFNVLSNFPSLKLNAKINNAYECKNYSLANVKELKMNLKENCTIDHVNHIIYDSSNTPYYIVQFNEGTLKLEETYDGFNVTTTIEFNINFDDYKSSWHYNLLEYQDNKYVAVTDHLACGFEMGLIPSYNVQGSSQKGQGDIVTIRLVGTSQRGSEWAETWTEATLIPDYVWLLSEEWSCTPPPPPPVEMKYSFTLNDSSTVSAECDDTSAVIFPEVSAYTSTITSVELGDCVDNIGNWAFSGCTSLTSFTMSDNVTVLGYLAFNSCPNLASIEIPSGITEIQFGTFSNCYSLTSVTIPNAVTAIGDGAFGNCTGLTSITIPSGVTEIGGGGFDGCISLTSITVEATTPPALEDHVFTNTNNCPIYVPCESVDTYKNNTYWSEYSSRIQCIAIPKFTFILSDSSTITGECDSTSAITSGEVQTYRTSIVSVIIGNCVTTINDTAFNNCHYITSMTIPNSVTAIGSAALGCQGLKRLNSDVDGVFNLPDSVTSIGTVAFQYCYGLTSIDIPSGVTSISDGTFFGCSGLTSIDIPSGVTTIGSNAFRQCYNLTSVTVNATMPPTLGNDVFLHTSSNMVIYVPCESLNTYKTASGWSTYADRITCIPFEGKYKLTLQDSSTVSAECDSTSSITSGEVATQYSGTVVSAEIGNCVTSIGDAAFYQCSGLTSITIPSGVTSIDYGAFAYCRSLASIDIPNCVTSIGDAAFYQCSGLTSITIPSGVTSIGNVAFYECSGLTSITIPSGVTTIGGYAFRNCTGLTSVTIYATTPPTLGTNVFLGTNNCPIYVPSGSVSAYQTAWSAYASRIQAIP